MTIMSQLLKVLWFRRLLFDADADAKLTCSYANPMQLS
jgi:hypothetical protein